MSIGETLASIAKFGGGVVDIIDARNQRTKQQNLEAELARKRAETDRFRAEAEAAAQTNALAVSGDMQANLQKYLGWSVAALAIVAAGVGLGRFFGKRGR